MSSPEANEDNALCRPEHCLPLGVFSRAELGIKAERSSKTAEQFIVDSLSINPAALSVVVLRRSFMHQILNERLCMARAAASVVVDEEVRKAPPKTRQERQSSRRKQHKVLSVFMHSLRFLSETQISIMLLP